MELPNTSLQAIELNPSFLGQAHFNRSESMEPGYMYDYMYESFTGYTVCMKAWSLDVSPQYSVFHL